MMQPRHIITVTSNKFSLYSCVQVDMVAFVLKSGSGVLNTFVATMVLSGGLFSRKSGWIASTHAKYQSKIEKLSGALPLMVRRTVRVRYTYGVRLNQAFEWSYAFKGLNRSSAS
jgi:hypothetical protein